MRRIKMDTAGSTLICVVEPKPQIKNYQTGEVYTDRETGAPVMTVGLTIIEEGRAESLEMGVPQPGLPEGLKMGDVVTATGMTAFLWEKPGKHGVMFSAKALTIQAAAGTSAAVA